MFEKTIECCKKYSDICVDFDSATEEEQNYVRNFIPELAKNISSELYEKDVHRLAMILEAIVMPIDNVQSKEGFEWKV